MFQPESDAWEILETYCHVESAEVRIRHAVGSTNGSICAGARIRANLKQAMGEQNMKGRDKKNKDTPSEEHHCYRFFKNM